MEWVLRPLMGESRLALTVLMWVILVVGVWWGIRHLYRRERQTLRAGPRRLMAGLRVFAMALLLFVLLLRPGLRVGIEGDIRRQVVVLTDTSGSMALRDPRLDPADVKRAAIALGRLDAAKGLDQTLPSDMAMVQFSRSSLAKGMLGDTEKGLLAELARTYDVRTFNFGKGLDGGADATAIGNTLREVLQRVRGQPVAGVLLVTDGANNSGASPTSTAEAAAAAGVPVFTYGVGLTKPRDLIAATLNASEIGFAEDEVSATLRLRTAGFAPGSQGALVIKLGGQVVQSQQVALAPDREETVTFNFVPPRAGEFELTAELSPQPGEMVVDNNAASTRIRIIDGKMRVLYMESYPRWEFKYLQAMLLRDRRIDAKFVLLEGSPSLADGVASPYLTRVPATREEWMSYDVVLVGDVDPRAFSAEQYAWMREHVETFGAGLVFIPGRSKSPMWANSEIEKLLPVEWPTSTPALPATEAVSLELTPTGSLADMLRLADGSDASRELWATLPGLYWIAPALRARPGAEVLVVDSRPPAPDRVRFGKIPVLATQQLGVGSILYLGTDNLWRIRQNKGDELHSRLWAQIIQRMGITHLLGESRRTRLTVDKRTYSPGDTISISARLYSSAFLPITTPIVRGELKPAKGGTSVPVLLRAQADQPGDYRGEAIAGLPQLPPGSYTLSVETDPATVLPVTVEDLKLELADTAMNEPLLRQIAAMTNGAFLREEDLFTLPDLLSKSAQRIRSTYIAEIWSSPVMFMLLLALFSAEWFLRRRAVLK